MSARRRRWPFARRAALEASVIAGAIAGAIAITASRAHAQRATTAGDVNGHAHAPPGAEIPAALQALATRAATAVERFRLRATAVREGYRRVGTDFPGMGEHWLHPASLLRNEIDPERPTILAYATINGAPVLTGVGFVVTVRGHERAAVPGWPEFWHEHSGLLADESGGAAHAHADTSASATRVWVLHIWTHLPNPHGRFAPDNWALPLARRGVTPPATFAADAGRVWALTTGSDAYWLAALTDAGVRNATNGSRIDAIVREARERAAIVVTRAVHAGALDDAGHAELVVTWRAMRDALVSIGGPDVRALLGDGQHELVGRTPPSALR